MKITRIVVVAACLVVVTGCLPEEPAIPNGAQCTPDGYVVAPPDVSAGTVRIDPITGEAVVDLDFVYDETGGALTCDFTY